VISRILFAHIALFAVTAVSAQTPASPAPATLHKNPAGLQLRLPAGWTATNNGEGILLLPQDVTFDPSGENIQELYVAGTETGYTTEQERQVVEQLSAGFLKGGMTVVRVRERQAFTAGRRNAAAYTWELREPGKPSLYAMTVYLAPAGSRVFVLLALGELDRVRSRDAVLRNVLAEMDHAAPATAGPLADSTPAAQQWLAKLRGKLVRQFIGGAGTAGERRWLLREDGTYQFRSSVAIAADIGPYGEAPSASAGSTGRSANSGRWRIVDQNGKCFLQLVADNGETRLLSLVPGSPNWFLNGEKAFAVAPE
jgi:hypothetical protein